MARGGGAGRLVSKAMTRLFAVANQKGGVAKTTTVHSLGAALAERDRRVLLVDLDPQACLTFSLGVEPGESLHDVIVHQMPARDVIVKVGDLHLLPSVIDLAGAEIYLLSKSGREYALAKALAPIAASYDVVLIDCPPSLGILTINGLTAADEVIIPLQCETLSGRGVGQLLETVEDVRRYTNPKLDIAGVVATMYDGRTRLSQQVLASAHDEFGLEVLPPPVPKSVKVAEAPGMRCSVLEHAPHSPAAGAYRALAATVEARLG